MAKTVSNREYIPPGAVDTDEISDGAVSSAKIADGAVDSVDMADSAVTSAKIADGEVDSVDMADSAITSAKIADGEVAPVDTSTDIYQKGEDAIDSVSTWITFPSAFPGAPQVVATGIDVTDVQVQDVTSDSFQWVAGAAGSARWAAFYR